MMSIALKTFLLFLCLTPICHAQTTFGILAYGDFPKGVSISVSQAAPLADGRLTMNITLTSSGKSKISIPSMLLPGESCDTPFYFLVVVEGRGVRVPKYCVSPYPGPDFVLKPGQTKTFTFTFDPPELKNENPKKHLIEFAWLVRHSKNLGQSGVVEIK